ncbi:MAG TPA: sigma-70 family RNA polymerase sigma factor [Verrucomicrobiae bacterium]|nr:sigma-70 family RNA polymerase sigma factor [Verrucomicrobiae bacterium]
MLPSTGSPDRTRSGAARFQTTQWSVIMRAGQGAEEALVRLCRNYWTPLYAYARRRGNSAPEAEDLTQSFFAHILEHRSFANVAPAKGRFRTFLLVSLKNFIENESRRDRAQKRGGGRFIISWEDLPPGAREIAAPDEQLSPEKLYDREWALTLVSRVLKQLQKECEAARKSELFERLKGGLTGQTGEQSYKQIAAELKMSEGSVKVSAHRLRRRFGELLREQVERTVSDPAQVEDELREILSALG